MIDVLALLLGVAAAALRTRRDLVAVAPDDRAEPGDEQELVLTCRRP